MLLLNKLFLFLVEGKTDERSLALTLTNLLKGVKFFVIKSDITSDKNSSVENIENVIFNQIDFFLAEKPQFEYKDISYVIQITDTDGCFIDSTQIIEDGSCDEYYYEDNSIRYKDPSSVIERNARKASIIKHLSATNIIQNNKNGKVIKLNYRMYFMSCNLEHVLHDKRNVTPQEKTRLSEDFEMSSGNNPHLLRDTLSNVSVICADTYDDSWSYIRNGNNSLKRKSNLELFFREFVDKTKRNS